MTEIHVAQIGDAHGKQIARFLTADFPLQPRDPAEVLEALTTVFIQTAQTRYGPQPNPESLVAIRNVLRHYIANQQPIPVLIPWGSKKPTNLSVDIAEVGALKMIHCIDQQAHGVYEPGLRFVMRVEDAGGSWLFRDEGAEAMRAQAAYVDNLQRLLRITGLDHTRGGPLTVALESELMDAAEYYKLSESLAPLFVEYLEESDLYGTGSFQSLKSWSALALAGWKGEIPIAQRDFYRSRYGRHYDANPKLATQKLADYFAGSLARYKLGGTGAQPEWGGIFITMSFPQPVPGTPPGIADRRIYMRTLPARYARTHIPAWRAKGYVMIENDTVTPKLTSPHDLPAGLQQCDLIFSDDHEDVLVSTDYVIAEEG